MMSPQLRIVPALTLALSLLAVTPVFAGPDEDYAAGMKFNERGDVVAALPLLQKAADAGHAAAQAAYGLLLDQADNDEEAVEYFRKSAMQGNAEGQFGLAGMYATGEGMPKKDEAEALKYFNLAAKQGHVMAINQLAQCYMTGCLGIPESDRKGKEALNWIRQAADNGFRPAMETLVNAYKLGEMGLPADPKLAEQWAAKVRQQIGKQDRRKRGAKKEISLEKK
jgi:TPR repeat protein